MNATCKTCNREIVLVDGVGWVDPEATGDDNIWALSCDGANSFVSDHEPHPWYVYKVPSQPFYAVRNTETGDYVEGDFRNAVYAAGTPHWSRREEAETVAEVMNGVEW